MWDNDGLDRHCYRLFCACEIPGLKALCGNMGTVQRLIFVVPKGNFDLMTEQPLVTIGKKQMQPDSTVSGVKQYVLALP